MNDLGKCKLCPNDATVLYPLLSGAPAFCSGHDNPQGAGRFGADFTGPDDFDIPVDETDVTYEIYNWEPKDFDRETFLWRDIHGCKWPLHEIDDLYLHNIISLIKRKLPTYDLERRSYFQAALTFLQGEQQLRYALRRAQ